MSLCFPVIVSNTLVHICKCGILPLVQRDYYFNKMEVIVEVTIVHTIILCSGPSLIQIALYPVAQISVRLFEIVLITK